MIKPTSADYLRALFRTDSMADTEAADPGFSSGLLGVCEFVGGTLHFAGQWILFVALIGFGAWLVKLIVKFS